MAADPIRLAAHSVLVDVLIRNLSLETALPNQLNGIPDGRDRAFCHQLVLTTLRRHGALRRIVGQMLDRPLPRNAGPVALLLELGLAQMFVLKVSDHAAIDTTVQLTGALRADKYRGLVNAILRRAQREAQGLKSVVEDPLACQPDWLKESWIQRFGDETALAMATANLQEPPLDITVRDDPEGWAKKLDGQHIGYRTIRRAAGTVNDLPGFEDGGWWVQDAAAALPAQLLPLPESGPVLDLCAAPGGKTAQLAASRATVIAVDRNARRLRRLNENMARLNLSVMPVEADAATWRCDTPVDAILLDAPCSATGTIRRRPDIAWTKNPSDVESLAPVQSALLKNAVSQLNSGGVLVYSVCSVEAAEGQAQIQSLLADTPNLERLPVTEAELGTFSAALTDDGDVQTLPCHLAEIGGMDGFFISRLRRTGNYPQ